MSYRQKFLEQEKQYRPPQDFDHHTVIHVLSDIVGEADYRIERLEYELRIEKCKLKDESRAATLFQTTTVILAIAFIISLTGLFR